jgi:pimeloyl-ACP methyl ester carboxylesterase
VVVGHSLAGLALPLVPELANVSALIYLASLLPEPRKSWRDQLSETRPMADWFYSHALPNQRSDDQGRTLWPTRIAEQLFFHDCVPVTAYQAARQLRPQAATPLVEVTPVEQFSSTPTYYVIGREDRAVSGGWAAHTAADRLGVPLTWIDGSHSPFLARPAELARTLAALAAEPAQEKTV